MGDAGHHWVGLCPKPRHWSWFGGYPRVEAWRVSPTIDEMAYTCTCTVHIEIHNGERGSGGCGERGSGGWVSNKPQSRL